jgi:hypothetical protein
MDYSGETMGCAPRMAIDDAHWPEGQWLVSQADGGSSVAPRASQTQTLAFVYSSLCAARMRGLLLLHPFSYAAAPRPSAGHKSRLQLARPEATLFLVPKVLSINRCARALRLRGQRWKAASVRWMWLPLHIYFVSFLCCIVPPRVHSRPSSVWFKPLYYVRVAVYLRESAAFAPRSARRFNPDWVELGGE